MLVSTAFVVVSRIGCLGVTGVYTDRFVARRWIRFSEPLGEHRYENWTKNIWRSALRIRYGVRRSRRKSRVLTATGGTCPKMFPIQ